MFEKYAGGHTDLTCKCPQLP